MKNQRIHSSVWTIVTLIFVLAIAGCGNIPATVVEPTPSSAPEASASPPPEAVNTEAAASQAPTSDPNALYQDDFTNPATGWPQDKFDNYFIGYHEPEYYHVEITSGNYK